MCIRDRQHRAQLHFFFSSRRRHTRQESVSWARRCVQETGVGSSLYDNMSMSNDQNLQFNLMTNNPLFGLGGGNPLNVGVMPQGNSQDEHSLNYYQEYCKLFIANVVLTSQIKELLTEKNELISKLTRLEVQSNTTGGFDSPSDSKKRRFRRTAAEISRHYKCPVERCLKSYGSEGSLNQHMKLKHPNYVGSSTKSENGNVKSSTAHSSPKNENGGENRDGNAGAQCQRACLAYSLTCERRNIERTQVQLCVHSGLVKQSSFHLRRVCQVFDPDFILSLVFCCCVDHLLIGAQ
eukprot:TRINITY_DN409_c0_g1_i2.p1 TRINITY_DN409_c0_g1~~TRINITY_DN409_c0_g1_i2.p1  ORF type:complete len:293 (-),score=26.68 TRINITY_DN409_c0_g1_i2:128-1006(-)